MKIDQSFQSSILCSRKWKICGDECAGPSDKIAVDCAVQFLSEDFLSRVLVVSETNTRSDECNRPWRNRSVSYQLAHPLEKIFFHTDLIRPSTNQILFLLLRDTLESETKKRWQRSAPTKKGRQRKLSARNCPPNDPIKCFFFLLRCFSLLHGAAVFWISKRVQPGVVNSISQGEANTRKKKTSNVCCVHHRRGAYWNESWKRIWRRLKSGRGWGATWYDAVVNAKWIVILPRWCQ